MTKLIKLGFLPYEILVCWGMTLAETRKMVKRKYDITAPDVAWRETRQGKTIHAEGFQTIIWLKWPPKKAPWTLAHESVHAMNFITDTCGIHTSQENDEVVAYGVEFITRTILEP